MGKATLVIMAAGIGSRFGGGVKQLEKVGPSGEIIMDYSIYDAIEAGFDKVIFVIRRDMEADFRQVIGERIEKKIEVEYAFQELDLIPKAYKEANKGRTKPWGTGQAILVCKEKVKEPFLVINADDYYGKESYQLAFEALTATTEKEHTICMIGFLLANTLSENGGVTRGVCEVAENQMLAQIVETKNIIKTENGAGVSGENGIQQLPIETPVSMNMWGLTPWFLNLLEEGFEEFFETALDLEKEEYLLPVIIGDCLKKGVLQVKVLETKEQWFGVTYQEDKEAVMRAIRKLVALGIYQEDLWSLERKNEEAYGETE